MLVTIHSKTPKQTRDNRPFMAVQMTDQQGQTRVVNCFNPNVYNNIPASGQADLTLVQGQNGYWDITGVSGATAAVAQAGFPQAAAANGNGFSAPAAAPTPSSFPSDPRQENISRSVALAQAMTFYKDTPAGIGDIMTLAEELVVWLLTGDRAWTQSYETEPTNVPIEQEAANG